MRMKMLVGMLVGVAAVAVAAQANRPTPVNKNGEIYNFKDTATLTVDSVTLNFFPSKGRVLGDPRKQGKQFVRVQVGVTNAGSGVYSVNYTNFYLQTSDGTRHSTTSSINKGNSDDRLESTKLDPKGSTSGALYYEVSRKETLDTLTFVYTGRQGTDHKDTLIPLAGGQGTAAAIPAASAPAASAASAAAPAAPKAASQLGANLQKTMAGSLEGPWVLDMAKSKAAPDGNTAGLMAKLTLNGDGTFVAGAGVTGKYTFDGKTLVVTYANSPGLQKKGGIDGQWLKFPAPAGLNRYCYMVRPK
jgi:hypothetical protein